MSRLFITEKKSIAELVAQSLGPVTTKKGYFEAGGHCITWCQGHLYELMSPKGYKPEWAKWNLSDLPYVIDRFRRVVTNKERVKTIAYLLEACSEVVHAGDSDREGQLIVDEVLEELRCRKPVLRLLPNATDPAGMRKQLSSMRPNHEFRNLFESGFCRQRADWLIGMNLTVAVTKCVAGDKLASIGRVQTPTLALVVRRDEAIETFVSRNFFSIEVTARTKAGDVTLTYNPKDEARRFWSKEDAKAAIDGLKGKRIPLSVKQERKLEGPPKLFTLPAMQTFMSKNYKWSTKKTLEVLQKLYEMQITSYPRSERDLLWPQQEPEALPTAANLVATGHFSTIKDIPLATRAKNYKLPASAEHHAIIPTLIKPNVSTLDKDHLLAWQTVSTRFLMNLLPNHVFFETTISTRYGSIVIGARGRATENMDCSWRVLEPKKLTMLPAAQDGELAEIVEVKLVQQKTTPPDRYTEGTLLEDMTSVAKFAEDERIKSRLTETSGIGTAATRDSIIEGLIERGYLEKQKGGVLISMPFGRELIHALPKILTDAALTALWEDALTQVADGHFSGQEFLNRINLFVAKQIDAVKVLQGKVILTPPVRTEPRGQPRSRQKPGSSSPRSRKDEQGATDRKAASHPKSGRTE